MCLRNLTKRKMRTFLTVSGVLIGTCAIIIMVSLGIGMDDAQSKMISEWADLTLIRVYNYGGVNASGEEIPAMTDDLLDEFKAMDYVQAVTPFYTTLQTGSEVAVYSEDYAINWAPFVGVYMDDLEDFGYQLKDGRWANDKDPKGTVLFGKMTGSEVYDYVYDENLWSGYDENENPLEYYIDPFNDEIHIIPLTRDTETWQTDYSVIGSMTAENMDYDMELNVVGIIDGSWRDYYTMYGIFVDIDFISEYIKAYNEMNPDNQYQEFNGEYNDVRVRVTDMDRVPEVEEALQAMGYQTYSDGQQRENMKQQTQMIQMMLFALAAVSLFVAALNITNTMVMAIIERTKEIGIMKVLGCDISKIRMMFLGEAAAIGFLGGVVGIVISYGVSFMLNTFLKDALIGMMGGESSGFSFPEDVLISQIPPYLAVGALVFATCVGVISGFYPANRGVRVSALSAISHD